MHGSSVTSTASFSFSFRQLLRHREISLAVHFRPPPSSQAYVPLFLVDGSESAARPLFSFSLLFDLVRFNAR